MDHCFMCNCTSVPSSRNGLAGSSLQVSQGVYLSLPHCAHVIRLIISCYESQQAVEETLDRLLYLYEGTRRSAPVGVGHFPKGIPRQCSFLLPTRTWPRCSGTCPGWRCPICWINSYILVLKGLLLTGRKDSYWWSHVVKAQASSGGATRSHSWPIVVVFLIK